MSRSRFLLCLIVFACAWGVAPVAHAAPAAAPALANPLVVYLHGGGGRVVAADRDDAPGFASNILKGAGLAFADVPAFKGAPGEWKEIMACVRHYYAGLPIELVDQRPTAGDYLMLVVGGLARDIGYQKLWGLSSTRKHKVVERGVGFVFSGAHPASNRVQRLCETTSHEIGHLLGLPHTDSCDDLMTSNNTCVRQAPIYGFGRENWSGIARAIDRWRTKAHRETDETVNRSAAHPR